MTVLYVLIGCVFGAVAAEIPFAQHNKTRDAKWLWSIPLFWLAGVALACMSNFSVSRLVN